MTTALYRYFDEHDRLLYVGISSRPITRLGEHRKSKTWWTQIARVTIEHHPTRDEALAAEAEAIRTEYPIHNIKGAHGPVEMHWACRCARPAEYLQVDTRTAAAAQEHAQAQAHTNGVLGLHPVSTVDIERWPPLARWEVVCDECDNLGDAGYYLETSELQTLRDTFQFLAHVCEKDWVLAGTDLSALFHTIEQATPDRRRN